MLKKYFIFFCLMALHILATPQSYAFRHLTTEDGLLSDLRLVFTEDRQGRLWIGSDEGINIFDGYQLSTYTQPDSAVMKTNIVYQIFCDKHGAIWIATPQGILFKNENDSRFRKLETGLETFTESIFFGETTDSNLIIVNRNNCYLVKNNQTIIKLDRLEKMFSKNGSPLCFEQFSADQWLIGYRKKTILVNIKEQLIVNEMPVTGIWCAAKVNDSTIITGSFFLDSVLLVKVKTGIAQSIGSWLASDGKPIGGYGGAIKQVGKHQFALASRYYGVYIIDLQKQNALVLQHDASEPTSLNTWATRRLFVTRNGTMFVLGRGISFTSLSIPQFNGLKYITNPKGEKYDGGINTVLQDRKKNYWLGTNAFLALWKRETNTCTYFPYFDIKKGPQKFKTIRAVVTDRLDRVWVGTFGGGMGLLQPSGGFEQYWPDTLDKANSLPSVDIHSIAKDNQENFIFCTNGGFALFDPVAKKMQTFYNHPKLSKIASVITFHVLVDKNNNWWLAQINGLYYYDRAADSLHHIVLPGDKKDVEMHVVAFDSSGMVYAGGLDGVYIISPKDLLVKKTLDKRDGLASNNIVGLLCDKMGSMWILGNIGTSKYDPALGTLQSFDARDGIEKSNHTLCNFYLAEDGEVFLTGSAGFNFFYPNRIHVEKKPLQVYITGVELKDSSISMPQQVEYAFEYHQNNLSFSYLAVDFKLGTAIQYRYRLNGFDTSFSYAGKQRTARYTNLPAGKYAFTVEASINGKDWYATASPVNFIIAKAFWKTWLFIFLMLALLAAAIFIFFYFKVKKVRKEEAVKRDFESKIAQVRMNLLRTQMNPHFLFNSLNSINSFILKNDRQNASGYLTKFSRLMRLILDNSRNEWVVLDSELKAIELYVQLEALRFNHAFNHHIEKGPGIDAANILLPPMLVQPYIENAIWHGLMYRKEPGGLLTINITDNNGMLEVLIKDNGVGREAATALKSKSALQQKSYGMRITAERMNSVNESYHINAKSTITDLFDADGNASGTEVLLTLDKIVNTT